MRVSNDLRTNPIVQQDEQGTIPNYEGKLRNKEFLNTLLWCQKSTANFINNL